MTPGDWRDPQPWVAQPMGAEGGPLTDALQRTIDAACRRRLADLVRDDSLSPLHLLICLEPQGRSERRVVQDIRFGCAGIPEVAFDISPWPERFAEFECGSIYFAVGDRTVFRMPIRRLVAASGRHLRVYCNPDVFEVERRRVRSTSRWRYLLAGEAPPDLVRAVGAITLETPL